MNYKATILGKTYDLPPRTLAVDEQLESMAALDKAYQSGERSRRETVQKMHDFVCGFAPDSIPPVYEVDTNDLMDACNAIVSAYTLPAQKAKMDAQLAAARELLSKPEIQKLLTIAPMLNKKK